MHQTFTIRKLTVSNSQDTLSLVASQFSADSPLHQAMGITPREYYNYLAESWQEYAFKGPVSPLGAFCVSTHELVGCLIASHFPAKFDHADKLPNKHKPIAALLQNLEQQYLQQNKIQKNCLLVDLAVVKKSHRGCGVYRKLREELHALAASCHYKTVYGELSSSATQHVCVTNMQHEVVAEINYSDFQYGNDTPFSDIESPRSIQLVRTSV